MNTYRPCPIDLDESALYETARTVAGKIVSKYQLHVVVEEPIPDSVTMFHYFVRPNSLPENSRWATEDDVLAKATDMRSMTKSEYELRRGLIASERAEDETGYCVTVFTVYDDEGTTILSAPAQHSFNRGVIGDMYWKFACETKLLTVEFRANMPLTRRPSLVLRCSPSSEMRQELRRRGASTEAVALAEIPGEVLESPKAPLVAVFEISDDVLHTMGAYSGWNLSISAVSHGTDQFTPRLARGYDGKVR